MEVKEKYTQTILTDVVKDLIDNYDANVDAENNSHGQKSPTKARYQDSTEVYPHQKGVCQQ